jgi:hypothetical protein
MTTEPAGSVRTRCTVKREGAAAARNAPEPYARPDTRAGPLPRPGLWPLTTSRLCMSRDGGVGLRPLRASRDRTVRERPPLAADSHHTCYEDRMKQKRKTGLLGRSEKAN